MKNTKESLQANDNYTRAEISLQLAQTHTQEEAQILLQATGSLMSDSLRIVNTFRPFDLSVEIKAALSDLKSLPNPYSPLKRWLYQLPIIGIYFSPITSLHQRHLKILEKIERLNNLLNAQSVQIAQKISELSALSEKIIQLKFQINRLLNHQSSAVKEDLSCPAKMTQQSAQSYAVLLKTNLHALMLHDLQLQQSIASISRYLTEINLIIHEITPLWRQQLRLTETLSYRKNRLKIINSGVTQHLPTKAPKRKQQTLMLSEITLSNEENSFKNIFDLNASIMLESKTIDALETILISPSEIKSQLSVKASPTVSQ